MTSSPLLFWLVRSHQDQCTGPEGESYKRPWTLGDKDHLELYHGLPQHHVRHSVHWEGANHGYSAGAFPWSMPGNPYRILLNRHPFHLHFRDDQPDVQKGSITGKGQRLSEVGLCCGWGQIWSLWFSTEDEANTSLAGPEPGSYRVAVE